MQRGEFIVIDGIDGAGKSTQIRLMRKKFAKSKAVFTHEPGGSPKAEEIRNVLLKSRKNISTPLTDLFLFWASRAAHVEQTILPALRAGKHVITDRFDSSTFAYQVYAEGRPDLQETFLQFRKAVLSMCTPDAYIFLDMPAKKALARRTRDRAQRRNRFDTKPLSYHEKVRHGFRKFKPGRGSKVFFVNANRIPEEVHADVLQIVRRLVS